MGTNAQSRDGGNAAKRTADAASQAGDGAVAVASLPPRTANNMAAVAAAPLTQPRTKVTHAPPSLLSQKVKSTPKGSDCANNGNEEKDITCIGSSDDDDDADGADTAALPIADPFAEAFADPPVADEEERPTVPLAPRDRGAVNGKQPPKAVPVALKQASSAPPPAPAPAPPKKGSKQLKKKAAAGISPPPSAPSGDLSPAERLKRNSEYLRDGGLTFAERGIRLSVDHAMALALSVHSHGATRPSAALGALLAAGAGEGTLITDTAKKEQKAKKEEAKVAVDGKVDERSKCASGARIRGAKSGRDTEEDPKDGCLAATAPPSLLAGAITSSGDVAKPAASALLSQPKRRLKEYERLVERSCGALEFAAKYLSPDNGAASNAALFEVYARLRKGDAVRVVVADQKSGERFSGRGVVEWTPLYGGRAMVSYAALDGRTLQAPESYSLPPNGHYLVSLNVT